MPSTEAAAEAERAKAFLEAGETDAGIAACHNALALDPDCLAAHVTLARAMLPGDDFLVWLARFHRELAPSVYLEIGVDAGRTLSLARPPTRAFGVDPVPAGPFPFSAATRTFAMESDAFFASPLADEAFGGSPIALAFIDSLHLFEQAVRDFRNVERRAAHDSVVLFHDCLPLDRPTAARKRATGFWTGDVWKMVPTLCQYRPDLDVFVIPAYPTGLGVVTRLDPASTVLFDRFDEIVGEYVSREWAGVDATFPLIPNDEASALERLRRVRD